MAGLQKLLANCGKQDEMIFTRKEVAEILDAFIIEMQEVSDQLTSTQGTARGLVDVVKLRYKDCLKDA